MECLQTLVHLEYRQQKTPASRSEPRTRGEPHHAPRLRHECMVCRQVGHNASESNEKRRHFHLAKRAVGTYAVVVLCSICHVWRCWQSDNNRRCRRKRRPEWHRRLWSFLNVILDGRATKIISGFTSDHDWQDRCWLYVCWRWNGSGKHEHLDIALQVPAKNVRERRVKRVDTLSHRSGSDPKERDGYRRPLLSCLQSHHETLPSLCNSPDGASCSGDDATQIR